jgi:hypothetical protein
MEGTLKKDGRNTEEGWKEQTQVNGETSIKTARG